jgi:hypothetical protein
MGAVSGRRRWQLLVCVIAAAVLAGCSGGPPATPRWTPVWYSPEPSPEPTEPSPWSSGWGGWEDTWDGGVTDALVAACRDGTPVPGAAHYAGSVHPLLVVDMDDWSMADVPINRDFPGAGALGWSWPSPIQLVVCAVRQEKRVDSCGLYKSGKELYEVIRKQGRATIRVIEAATGKTLQKKVLTNPAPRCPKRFTTAPGYWVLVEPVTDKQINRYATSVSKQTAD